MKKNSFHNFYLLVILGLFLGCAPRTEIPVSTSSASSFENIKPIAVDMRIFFNASDQIRGMNFSQSKPQNRSEFGIYPLEQEISIKQFQAADLQSLQLQKTPLISMADIISYSKSTHEIELIPSAYQRILDLYKKPGHVSGPPFVICVGSERIYGGAFWTMLSSASYDGVVILQPIQPDGRIIALRLGYPTRADFTGKDPRGDVRILTALDHAGKLK